MFSSEWLLCCSPHTTSRFCTVDALNWVVCKQRALVVMPNGRNLVVVVWELSANALQYLAWIRLVLVVGVEGGRITDTE